MERLVPRDARAKTELMTPIPLHLNFMRLPIYVTLLPCYHLPILLASRFTFLRLLLILFFSIYLCPWRTDGSLEIEVRDLPSPPSQS